MKMGIWEWLISIKERKGLFSRGNKKIFGGKEGKNYKIAVPILYNKAGKKTKYHTREGTKKMIPLLRNESRQKPLFHIIHEDDIYLLNTADAEWFQVLGTRLK